MAEPRSSGLCGAAQQRAALARERGSITRARRSATALARARVRVEARRGRPHRDGMPPPRRRRPEEEDSAKFLQRLLTDPDLRERFQEDPTAMAREAGVS